MLKSLLIRNYALIDELSVEFTAGLVIITGETGAGKSILVDSLGLLLGARTTGDVVRSGADRAVIEGVFGIAGNAKLKGLLEENGVDPADELILRREISSRGQSRCFVNDSPATLGFHKQIGDVLVDLHGQHEHQSLLRRETHAVLLDEFGGLEGLVQEYQTALAEMKALGTELAGLRQREQQLREKREFSEFQLREIDSLGLRPGEEEEMENELRILENSERLFAATGTLYEMLYEGEHSVHDLLVMARNQLQDLAEIDRQFREAAAECASATAVMGEVAKFIQAYNAGVEFNPERLEALRDRLGKLALLKRKYGGTLEAVIAHRDRIAEEIRLAENFDDVITRLAERLEDARERCSAIAQRLSSKRHDVARKVESGIVQELSQLGIPHARFSTRITQRELPRTDQADGEGAVDSVAAGKKRIALNGRGYDEVEFYVSTNAGEEERPLVDVASGGEVSRIMLALKSILAKSDRLPVLIFDEIDVGISGRVARTVGLSLKNLSGFHQVIAVTHLPQIAGLADSHYAVRKAERKGRTHISVEKLSLDGQVREVAKLMSGTEVTEAGLAGARELMGLP